MNNSWMWDRLHIFPKIFIFIYAYNVHYSFFFLYINVCDSLFNNICLFLTAFRVMQDIFPKARVITSLPFVPIENV